MKNLTRLAGLNGPWTGVINLALDVGNYKMSAYALIYITCNPMRSVNHCDLDTTSGSCNEIDNEICLLDENHSETCGRMDKNVSDWSDALMYLDFGTEFKLGPPINVDDSLDLGGFVGPYSVVYAQKPESNFLTDEYEMRYVMSPSDPYIRMNPDCGLMSEQDFEGYFGAEAIKETTAQQNNGTISEIYEPYKGTCANGSVKPHLPKLEFEFSTDASGKEILDVKFEYKLLVFPEKDDIAYDFMPILKDQGFPISGPYCYDGDPNRGWTIDMDYDSKDESILVFTNECISGYPCEPKGIETCSLCGVKNDPVVKDASTSVEVSDQLYLTVSAVVLSLIALGILCSNCYAERKTKRMLKLVEKENAIVQHLEVNSTDIEIDNDSTDSISQ